MATLSKALNATVTVLSVTCFALYLAGMLTPFLKTDTVDSFIWGKMCPPGKAVGDKSCTKVDVCDGMNSLMKASQAFFILSDIGALAAVAAGAGALLGKVPSVAPIGAAAAMFVFGTITVGVSFPVWTQKQCGQSMSYAKMDGVKMGPCLKLLIAAYVLSFAALAAAIASHVLGGGAAAQGAGDVSGAKQVDNGAPLRQEPPASTLVPVQAQESQNPLDKEQPKQEEPPQQQPEQQQPERLEPEQQQPEQQQEKAAPQPQHQQPTVEEQAQSEKRAKVLAIDFEELKRKLPATKGDEAQKAQRFAMFDRIDVQGKGALDVAEVTAGLRDVLQVGDAVASLDVVIAKAFAKAAAAGQAAAGNAGGEGAATVEKNEFRLLLLYIRQYFRVFQIFATIDATGDNRMALDEFRTAQPEFAAMGLKIADADATFHAIDADKSGVVDFHEFAMWALEQDGVLSG